MRLTSGQLQDFRTMGRQFPGFVEYLNAFRAEELENLAVASDNNVRTQQGRVQILREIQKVVQS